MAASVHWILSVCSRTAQIICALQTVPLHLPTTVTAHSIVNAQMDTVTKLVTLASPLANTTMLMALILMAVSAPLLPNALQDIVSPSQEECIVDLFVKAKELPLAVLMMDATAQ